MSFRMVPVFIIHFYDACDLATISFFLKVYIHIYIIREFTVRLSTDKSIYHSDQKNCGQVLIQLTKDRYL